MRTLTQPRLEVLEPRLLLTVTTFGPNGEPWVAGDLATPSASDLAWQQQNMIVTQGVRLNAIGLSRINDGRRAEGLGALAAAQVGVVPLGAEAIGTTAAAAAQQQAPAAGQAVSGGSSQVTQLLSAVPFVDNSATPYFPPIRSQGSIGSCVAWALTYYGMTYMTALARGWNATSTTDNSTKFSPKWTYDMINGGTDGGAYLSAAYSLMSSDGAATWAEFPYDSDYRSWVYKPTASYNANTETSAQVWQNAAGYRLNQTGSIANVTYSLSGGTGLDTVKTYLANGYILNYACYINSWQWTTIKNDPSTTADDPFVGQSVASWTNGSVGGHAMTIVGYDDDVWVDINGNGVVDPGEKGALKIANSWGTGWGNGGYCWLAYDALNAVSVVAGAPSSGRQAAFQGQAAYWLTARPSYTPAAMATVTLQTADRSEFNVNLGLGSSTATAPASTFPPYALNMDGGDYGFDGVSYASNPSAAPAGVFAFDYTDLAPSLSTTSRYFFKADNLGDSTTPVTLSAFKVTSATGTLLSNDVVGPRPGDLPVVDASVSQTAPWAVAQYPDTQITGTVWADNNNNGIRDTGENGLANWNVFFDQNGNGVLDPTIPIAGSNTTSQAIPDATKKGNRTTPGTVSSTVAISGAAGVGTVADVNVTLDITHPHDSDLTVVLTSPSGRSVTLFSGVGASGQNFTGTTLDDQAATAIGSGSAPFTGAFKPSSPLSAFNGDAANGAWTLKVTDNTVGNAGTLVDWSLALTSVYETPEATTDASGNYTITRLAGGTYALRCVPVTGFAVTNPAAAGYNETLTAGQLVTGQSFGLFTAAPTIVQAAAAVVNPLNLAQYNLTALAADDGGESNLTYTWSTTSRPSGSPIPTFSVNGVNAAKSTVATLGMVGTYTMKVTATDAAGRTVTSSVTFTVSPVAANDNYTAAENTPLTVAAAGVLANDTAIGGPALLASLVSGPSHGSLSLHADGSFTYTPSTGYWGPDGFNYRASAGLVNSNVATVTVNVVESPTETCWTGPTGGDWASSGNWSNSVPTAASDVYIANGQTVVIASGVVQVNSLHILSGTLTLAAGGGAVLVAGGLELSQDASGNYTSTVDLNDNAMSVGYPAGGASPFAAIRKMIFQGFSPSGNNDGLISTAAQTNDFALGYAEASDMFMGGEEWPAGSGVHINGSGDGTVLPSEVLVRAACFGDANLDGVVDGTDFTVVTTNWNRTNASWIQGDMNYDGVVNADDFTIVTTRWNNRWLPSAQPSAGSQADAAAQAAPVTAPLSGAVGAVTASGPVGQPAVAPVATSLVESKALQGMAIFGKSPIRQGRSADVASRAAQLLQIVPTTGHEPVPLTSVAGWRWAAGSGPASHDACGLPSDAEDILASGAVIGSAVQRGNISQGQRLDLELLDVLASPYLKLRVLAAV